MRAALAGLLLGLTLGCSGVTRLLSMGDELGSAEFQPDRPIDLVVEGTGAPLELWIAYDLRQAGGSFRLSGDLDYAIKGGRRGAVAVALVSKNPLNQDSPDDPRDRAVWGLTRVADLPEAAPGARVRVRGSLHAEHITAGDFTLIVAEGDG